VSDTISEELSALPEYLQYIPTVIEVQKDLGGSGKPAVVFDLVLDKVAKSKKSFTESAIPSPSKLNNEMQRVRQTLVHAGLLDSIQKGVWTLTKKGLSIEPSDIDLHQLNEIRKKVDKKYREKYKRKFPRKTSQSEVGKSAPYDFRRRLIDRMRELSPADFEKICQEILSKSGFKRLRISGRNDDESCDGDCIFQEIPLMRSYVLFRFKCEERLIEAKEIKDFRRTMARRADKGIFMTMSFFSSDAKWEAQREGVSPIALVDKEKLVRMMERFKIRIEAK
jgi:restriction system protein